MGASCRLLLGACFLVLRGEAAQLEPTKPGHGRQLSTDGAPLNRTTRELPKPDALVAPASSPSSAPSGAPSRAPPNAEGVSLRPAFHIQSPNAWVNDPCGMFESRGLYHVFFQLNPVDSVWGAPSWGHVVSSDMAYWKRLPDALVPGGDYDSGGVFSGSATVGEDGVPLLFYTGASQFKSLGYYRQQQALAKPSNFSDLELKEWTKLDTNPVISTPPPTVALAEFRDPTTAWKDKAGTWHAAIGVQDECVGAAALYSSPNLVNWTFTGVLSSQIGAGTTNGTCSLAPKSLPGFGRCDQMGADCRAWECPDYFRVTDAVHVVKFSDQVNGREPYASDWYILGTLPDLSDTDAVPGVNSLEGAFKTLLPNGTAGGYKPQLWDFGAVYASKTFQLADGRRIWMSWVYETANGCYQQCSTGSTLTAGWGFQGALSLPRVVTYDSASHTLLANPMKELEGLRSRQLFLGKALVLTPGQSQVLLPAGFKGALLAPSSPSLGRQLELRAAFSPVSATNASASAGASASGEGAYEVGVVLTTGPGGQQTVISVSGRLRAAAGRDATLLEARLLVNKALSGGATNVTADQGTIPLPPGGLRVSKLDVRLFVDHSLLEVFVLGGRGRVASRFYPQEIDYSWGISAYATVRVSDANRTSIPYQLDAALWELASAWVDSVVPKAQSVVSNAPPPSQQQGSPSGVMPPPAGQPQGQPVPGPSTVQSASLRGAAVPFPSV